MAGVERSEPGRAQRAPSGRWKLGLLLSVVTVLLWSTVPVALSLLREQMNPATITCYRFLAGAAILALVLQRRGTLPPLRRLLSGRRLLLVSLAGLGLAGNFVVYLYALDFIPPGASQVVMQLFSLAFSFLAHRIWAERIMPDALNSWGLLGACIVVCGSMLAALGGRKSRR